MDTSPHSEADCGDATSRGGDTHAQASPCARAGAAMSSPHGTVDKLRLQVRIVLTRLAPTTGDWPRAQGRSCTTGSPGKKDHRPCQLMDQDDCAQCDRPSCDHRASSMKAGGVDRGVQVNLLHAEVCTEPTDRSAPQYTVDEEAILQLMKTCPSCNKQCRCNKYTRGPYFIVYQSCYFCDYRRKWASQPEALNMNIRKRQEQGLCKS